MIAVRTPRIMPVPTVATATIMAMTAASEPPPRRRSAPSRFLDRAIASPAVERAAIKVLDSELVDRVWAHLLASDEAQKLVERIAEAPEVRAALTQQGVGLIEDLGRGVREFSDHFDAAIDRVLGRLGGQ